MPVYQYHCTTCNKTFDIMKTSFDPKPQENCLICGKLSDKIVSKSSFKLKGFGWARNGYQKPKF